MSSSRKPQRRRTARAPKPLSLQPGPHRLQKVLAYAGIASRRKAEEMILAGRVTVNGQPVRELGTKVDPASDAIAVDGRPLPRFGEAARYIKLYKPDGFLSTFTDPEGRPTLARLVNVPERVYAAGRLDMDSEGLLLLSNDGELIHRLTHPRYEHPKEYLVLVEGVPTAEALVTLRHGVVVEGRLTAPATVEALRQLPEGVLGRPRAVRENVAKTWLRIVLREGRKRQIRHMTAAVGYPTLRIVRTAIGPLRLGRLAPGEWHDLSAQEVQALQRMVADPRPTKARP